MKYNIFKGLENEKRNNEIWYLHYEKGFSLRKLAKKFLVSHQRIAQILKDGNYILLKAENNSSKKIK